MEDQGKRLLLAVAIAFGLLWLWSVLFPSKPPEKKPEADPAAEVERRPDAETPESPDSKPPEVVASEPEQVVRFSNAKVAVELSSHGAAIKSWRMLEPQLEDRTKSPPVPLELVPTASRGAAFYSLQITLGKDGLAGMKTASWQVHERREDGVSFRWSDGDLEVFKHYKLDLEHFYVELTIDVMKKTDGESKQALTVLSYGFQDPKSAVGGGMTQMPREWKAACLVGDDVKTASTKSLLEKPARRDGNIRWGGFAHSYFVKVMAPEHEARDRLECDSYDIESFTGAMRVELTFPEIVVDKDDVYQRRLYGYFGPKRMSNLQAASHLAVDSSETDYNPGFEEVVDLGWLGFLSGPLLWLLTIFQGFVVNWGLAIILLTVVIKLLVLPWTHKSIKSMKAMSKLRPQMEKIKEKFEDDKQRQQVEMMNLFKSHGVNPLAGCLPMLLQMPIWFALYRMLMAAAELYQAPFIPGYIDDLTSPDPYYILPILVTGLMYFQTKLTPTTATGMQQKLLMYGMPLMFGVFSIWFPAGLTLYIFTNTCLTLIHHFFVHREDRERMAAEKKAGKSAVIGGGSDDDDGDADIDSDDGDDSNSDDGGEGSSKSAKKSSAKKGSTKKGSTKKGSTKKAKKGTAVKGSVKSARSAVSRSNDGEGRAKDSGASRAKKKKKGGRK